MFPINLVWILVIILFPPHQVRAQDFSMENSGPSKNGGADAAETGENSMAQRCSKITLENESFQKLSPSSKYLRVIPKEENQMGFTAQSARTACQAMGELDLAEVNHVFDLITLEKNLDVLADSWIGLSQGSLPGHFRQSDGSDIKFQTFVDFEPNNAGVINNDGERCVVLRVRDGFITMEDADCNQVHAGALCQYKKNTPCFKESAEEAASKQGPDYIPLEPVGSKFFMSTEQKTWANAKVACKESGLGLHLATLDDPEHYQELVMGVRKKLAEKHLHPKTQFWVGAIFSKLGDNHRMIWHLGDEGRLNVSDADFVVPYEWAPASATELEPLDQAGTGILHCLDVSFDNAESNKPPYWRASNCALPKYFLCEKVDYTMPNNSLPPVVIEPPDEGIPVTCPEPTQTPLKFEVNLDEPESDDYIVNFMMYSLEHDLRSGNVPEEVREEIKWKKEVITLLTDITKKVVPNDYVDHGFLNVAKFLNIAYQDAAKSENESANVAVWNKKFIPHFKGCLDLKAKKLKLLGGGFEITHYQLGDDPMGIPVPEEHADKLQGLDQTIDTLWYMFSLSLATCYDHPSKNRLAFASDLHVYFVKDFIDPLRTKWTVSVDVLKTKEKKVRQVDRAYMFGDVDFDLTYRNLRCCVTAAYMDKGLEDKLQLARPLDMTKVYRNAPMPYENGFTGEIYMQMG